MNLKKLITGRCRTSIDDAILNHMRSSGDFSSTEILLWEHFCSLVKFKKDRQVQIFRAQLAAMIHRSEPTITRHVRCLVKKGFLVRSANYRPNCKGDLRKVRTANSYQVCLPEQVYNKLDSVQIRLATESQVLEQRLKQLKIQQQNQTDSSWITSIDGARPINERLRCYLNRKLYELGYDPATAAGCDKFNEIVWSSRFGDMARNQYYPKRELAITGI